MLLLVASCAKTAAQVLSLSSTHTHGLATVMNVHRNQEAAFAICGRLAHSSERHWPGPNCCWVLLWSGQTEGAQYRSSERWWLATQDASQRGQLLQAQGLTCTAPVCRSVAHLSNVLGEGFVIGHHAVACCSGHGCRLLPVAVEMASSFCRQTDWLISKCSQQQQRQVISSKC